MFELDLNRIWLLILIVFGALIGWKVWVWLKSLEY